VREPGTGGDSIDPTDPSGVVEILGVVATPDQQSFAYTYLRLLTELYVVDGLE
jgi:hypothetical protein